jgi:hypothetical protein
VGATQIGYARPRDRFASRKLRTTTHAPVEAPPNVRLKFSGMQREIQLLCDQVGRARSYQVQKDARPERKQLDQR